MREPEEPGGVHQGGLAQLLAVGSCSGCYFQTSISEDRVGRSWSISGSPGQELGCRGFFLIRRPCCYCLSLLAPGCAPGVSSSQCDDGGRKGE